MPVVRVAPSRMPHASCRTSTVILMNLYSDDKMKASPIMVTELLDIAVIRTCSYCILDLLTIETDEPRTCTFDVTSIIVKFIQTKLHHVYE